MSRLLIGLPKLEGKLASYAKRYDLVEVRPGEPPVPAVKSLRRWRREVPPSFAFSVVLPPAVAMLREGPEATRALKQALDAATALEASCLVLITPPEVRPTNQNRQRIVELAARLPREAHVLAWEAAGLWTPEAVVDVAMPAGWLPVFDAGEQPLPAGPIAYTRLRGIGKATRLTPRRIERIAASVAGRRQAYVVADRLIARRLTRLLPEAVARIGVPAAVPQVFRPSPELAVSDDEEQ